MFTEHKIPRRPKPPPRPAWMDTDVVDPAWATANPGPHSPRGDDAPYIPTVIGTALDKAIEMTFDPKDKQKDYCDPSDTLIEARAVLLDTIAEVLPEKGLKRSRNHVAESISAFLTTLQTIILKDMHNEALTDNSGSANVVNWQDAISGAWQMIKDGHNDAAHICREDLLDAALAEMDLIEIKDLRDRLTDQLKYRS